MLPKSSLIPSILERIKKLPVGHYLDMRTYKRNRFVLIIRTGEDAFHLIEKGFYEEEFDSDLRGLKRLLKTLLKKEFPRSNKVRVYAMGEYVAGEAEEVGRKVL